MSSFLHHTDNHDEEEVPGRLHLQVVRYVSRKCNFCHFPVYSRKNHENSDTGTSSGKRKVAVRNFSHKSTQVTKKNLFKKFTSNTRQAAKMHEK
jgi:hypothetical protein